MGRKSDLTNLASEFYIMALLNRVGANAILTLGNKKSVDILVEKSGKSLTIDVKGLRAKHSNFPIDNLSKVETNHYLVFVSFLGKFEQTDVLPEVFIVPSKELSIPRTELNGETLIYNNPKGNRTVVQIGRLRKLKHLFKNNWKPFIK